jgi:hypothetical protein
MGRWHIKPIGYESRVRPFIVRQVHQHLPAPLLGKVTEIASSYRVSSHGITSLAQCANPRSTSSDELTTSINNRDRLMMAAKRMMAIPSLHFTSPPIARIGTTPHKLNEYRT